MALQYLPDGVVRHEAADLAEGERSVVVGLGEARQHADTMPVQVALAQASPVNRGYGPRNGHLSNMLHKLGTGTETREKSHIVTPPFQLSILPLFLSTSTFFSLSISPFLSLLFLLPFDCLMVRT